MRLFRGSSTARIGATVAAASVAAIAVAWLWLWRGAIAGVFTGRVLYHEDIAAYFEPLWRAAARAMRAGEWPSWAREVWGGQPLLGDPQLGIFYPPHWIWLAVDPLRAYALSVVGHAALAAAGAYALARALGRSRPASACAGIALSLGAYFVLEARHEMFLVSAAWLPWMMTAILSWTRSRSPRSIAAVALTFALALLGGGWSMMIFAAPVLGVFSVFALRRGARPARGAVGLAVGLGLGLGLAAVQLLPAFAHVALSPRALPLAKDFSAGYAWPSLRYAVTLALPTWYGDDARGTYAGAPDQWELCGYGSGVACAVLAIIAIVARRRRGRAERLAYLAIVALAALAALGPHGPLWPLLSRAPLLSRLRCPARALFAFTCALPILVAAGADRLRAALPRRASALAWLLPLAIAAELAVTFRAENPTVPIAEALAAPQVLDEVPRDFADTADRTLIDVHLGQRFHNGGARWAIQTPAGYSSLPLWRYLHLLWIANHGAPYPGWPAPRLADDLTAQGLWRYGSPIVDLLGVRRALVPRDRAPDAPGWRLERRGDDGIDLWTNREALPRTFVVGGITRVDEAEAARRIGAATFDPTREVLVEEDVGLPAAPRDPPMAVIVTNPTRRGADAFFTVTTARDGLLLFTEPYEPSWTVTVDDDPARLLRVDYALMGVRVSAGVRHVRFARVDRPLRAGAAITLVALLLCALLAAAGRRR